MMHVAPPVRPAARGRLRKSWLWWLVGLAAGWAAAAYVVVPEAWYRYARKHPALDDVPTVTHTADRIPGDPLNVAAVATENELKRLMLAAHWYPADPLTLRSCLEIAEATVLKRPYADAPVSNLFMWDRKEDLAFEKPVGDDPRKRHHVRFWKAPRTEDDRPVWVGSATFDRAVGLSHTTGQITHHIAPEIDVERDALISDWRQTGRLVETYVIADFQKTKSGRNGGGDPWHTDGGLAVGVVRPESDSPVLTTAPTASPTAASSGTSPSGD